MDLRKSIGDIRVILTQHRFLNMEILLFQSYLLCFAKYRLLALDRNNKKLEGNFAKISEVVAPLWKAVRNAGGDGSDFSAEDAVMNVIEDLNRYEGTDWYDVFEELMTDATNTFGRDFMSLQPREITELVHGLADYKGGKIYNPFGGLVSYALTFGAGDDFYGEEIDPMVWCIGTIRLMLSGKSSSTTNYVIGNSVRKREGKFSLVVSTPPHGVRDIDTGWDVEEFLMSTVPDYLEEGGTFIMVGALPVLTSPLYERARKYFTDNNLIESVIRLPDSTLSWTGTTQVVIKARKGKDNTDVTFFDASRYFKKERLKNIVMAEDILSVYKDSGICVTTDTIAGNGYQWAPGIYLEQKTEYPENSKKWGEIAQYINPVRTEVDHGMIIYSSCLTTDPLDINLEPLHPDFPSEKASCNMVKEPVLLLFASRDRTVRIGYVKASEKDPAYYSRNIFAFRINEEQLYTRYLAVELTRARIPDYQSSYMMYSEKEIMDLRIPVVPFDAQVETVKAYVASKPGSELLEKTKSDKIYSVLVCGQVDTSSFEGEKVNVVATMEEIPDNLLISYKGMVDAVVICPDRLSDCSLLNLVQNSSNLPVFIISGRNPKELNRLCTPEEYKKYFSGKLFGHGEEKEMLGSLRPLLDSKSTPESILRNLYLTELNAAKLIDETFGFDSSVSDLVMSFVLSRCERRSLVAEKSFDEIRKVRDNIIDELKKINAVPADLKAGAICDFLAKRYYKGQTIGTNYFLYKTLMPLPTAQALCFIKEISNEVVHQYNGEANLGYSLFHGLLSFILWTRDRIQDGFFDSQKQKGEYWDMESHLVEEFIPGGPRAVGCLKRGEKDYFYCDNVHIVGSGTQTPTVGMKIMVDKVKPENEPYIDDDGHKIYFLSTSKDWKIVSE